MAMRLLGEGGQGEVWHLPDTEPQMVMKKIFHTNNYASYLRELRVLKELSHENVVRYYDPPFNYPGINSNELLLFMEFCEHLSLRHVITDVTVAYSMATIAKWSTEMFSALEYIKSKKIVHHDVKPDNLFVYGHDYIVKLGDFGIVRDLKTVAKPRGGTPRYMAPEVENGRTLSGNDEYKCDIYGAGWVVLDMLTRNPGIRAMEGIFQDRLHLNTTKKLVVGCTKKFVTERFGVEDALMLCAVMAMEFEKSHAKPDPRPDRKRLEPPIGLLGDEDGGVSQYDDILPSPICSSVLDNTELDLELLQQKAKVDPRKRLLIELQERLQLVTAFEGTRDLIENYLHSYESKRLGRYPIDPLEKLLKRKAVKPKGFDKTRSRLCRPIFKKISRLSIEDQYKCATEMDKYWKMDAPKLFEGIQLSTSHKFIEKYKSFSKLEQQDSIEAILWWFESLIKCDACVQAHLHGIAAKALQQTDREVLPEWDTLLLLDQSIKNIEELGKLFAVRALYKLVNIENSRYSWYHLPQAELFLRADCTETRSKTLDKYVRNYIVKEQEPLNNEQLRRALVEARMYFKRKIQNQRKCRTGWRSGSIPYDLRLWLDSGECEEKYQCLLKELESVPDQPFPGYIFSDGHPPAHQCPEGECEIAGGFPRWADEQYRIRYHQCSTAEQIVYIEDYTLMLTALRYITNWKIFGPDFRDLLVNLIAEIKVKERRSVFFFAMFKLVFAPEALLFQIHPGVCNVTFIEKDMKLVQDRVISDVLRFVPLRLANILPILIEWSDEIQANIEFLNQGNFIESYLPKHSRALTKLWERLSSPELEGTISTTRRFAEFSIDDSDSIW